RPFLPHRQPPGRGALHAAGRYREVRDRFSVRSHAPLRSARNSPLKISYETCSGLFIQYKSRTNATASGSIARVRYIDCHLTGLEARPAKVEDGSVTTTDW